MKKLFLVCSVILIGTICACNKDAVCIQTTAVQGKMIFSTINDSSKTIDTLLPKPILLIDTFYTMGTKINTLNFELNSTKDSSTFYFKTDSASAVVDTFTMYYNRNLHFISKECGYNYSYNLQNIIYTKNNLKKVTILNAEISPNATNTHIQLFF